MRCYGLHVDFLLASVKVPALACMNVPALIFLRLPVMLI